MKKNVDIIPQRVNANKHTQRGMGELERSIQQDGWIGAITVAADGETFDGSARVETLATAGLQEPLIIDNDGTQPIVIRRTDIPNADDVRAKRLAVAANKIAADNLDWDAGVLAALAEETDLSQLFRDDELAALLADASPVDIGGAGDEFDTTPQDGPTRTQVGDLWIIGGVHRLLVGDCTDAANVARLMGGGRVDLVWIDPPYGIDYESATLETEKIAGDTLNIGSFLSCLDGIDDKTPLYICCDFRSYPSLFFALLERKRKVADVVVWDKTEGRDRVQVPPAALMRWIHSTEFIVYCGKQRENFGYSPNVIHYARVYGANSVSEQDQFIQDVKTPLSQLHPTIKPLHIVEKCLNAHDDARLVFDGFLGSGTTLIAAHQTGRRCYGMEISPRYADVILRRAEAAGLSCERQED